MKTQLLTLKAVSPLALHRRRASEQFAPSLDYLPGGAVRGALADLYLQGDSEWAKDELFQRLFLKEEVTFSDFLPTTSKHMSRLFPASAMACKRFDDKVHARQSLTDSLLRLELAAELDESGLLDLGNPDHDPLTLGDWKHCSICTAKGRYAPKRDRVEAGYYTSVELPERMSVRKRMMAGTAIERATGTAAHAMLFSHEVMEESSSQQDGEATLFRGAITLTDDLYDELNERLKPGQRLAMGYGRGRGLGQVVSLGWETAPSPKDDLIARWQALNQTVQTLWARYKHQPRSAYFTLTLESHLILRNAIGEPILGDVTAVDLGLPPEIARCRSILSATLISGWNAAQNLPKPDMWALQRGSVLLFRLPAGADFMRVKEQLERIEVKGLGERRAEGFGRISVCNEFHYYFLQQELKGVSQ